MQRQSLGSPSPRLNGHGRGGASIEISAASPSPSSPSASPVADSGVDAGDNDDVKLDKLHRRRSASPPLLRGGPEKYLHLIPILILLCFLVLYLCSHEPSPDELANINGFRHPSELAVADSRAIEEFERVSNKGDILAIRSLRNLQEIKKEASKSSRSHRKLGDF